MEENKNLPRLTGFIRAFGEISAPWSTDDNIESNDFVQKRKEKNEKQTKFYDLKMVKEYLYENSRCSSDEIDKSLKELMTIAQEIVSSESSLEIIEGVIIYLLELFKNCRIIGTKETVQLKRMFGIYSKDKISDAFKIVKQIVEHLNLDIQEQFLKEGFPKCNNGLEAKEYGSKCKLNGMVPLEDSYFLVPYNEEIEKEKGVFKKLSFKFDDNVNKNEKKEKDVLKNLSFKFDNKVNKNGHIVMPTPKSLNSAKKFNQQWLDKAIQDSLNVSQSPLSAKELIVSVSQLLKSNRSNEELENDLFDLLGFERIELIQEILEHRDEIIYSKIVDSSSKDHSIEKQPVCMSLVTIQSESEKLLAKQIRKDEKRIQKEQARGYEDNPAILDYRYLKQIRETQLIAAKNKPLFSKPSVPLRVRNFYPNVYDSYAETTMLASYVSGRKLVLPENHSRINNCLFEEISIPATKLNMDINVDLVSIEELDEIGQLAFKNTKNLNLIQSKVFDIAYHTNENMLVCAPTGAGKTNVAMLTIIHEIKNNIKDKVILKDKFKIVYVAPMKALAAEIVRNFSSRLSSLGIIVKELTGDMQLTKIEILNTQMLVTTPEKWDVVTRKSTGDISLSQMVKLLILDEVHLLDSDRGAVLEALVARTLRQVETSQSMIRIVGLSATLPNYIDVSRFLHVNPMVGLFFFDDRFRPVPLTPTFIGVKSVIPLQQMHDMDEICYRKVVNLVDKGHQVMIFVHARNLTVRTAQVLKEMALNRNQSDKFLKMSKSPEYGIACKNILKSKNKQLRELFDYGFAIHHAGMLRSDRNLVEKYFREGYIKVLVCTATLAWGVNLPARAVIIKGTELYDSSRGTFVNLNVLDVMQIFGRAGRPQYDTEGEGIIITSHDKLSHYLSIMTRQHQIESNFENKIADNLNAEIALGTVSNIDEAVEWLSYTYYYIRLFENPHHYGLKPQTIKNDYNLYEFRKKLILKAVRNLVAARMARHDPHNGYLNITDLGRTASHFYVSTETIQRFTTMLHPDAVHFTETEILSLISKAQEFDQLKVREDEMVELDHLIHECKLIVAVGCENKEGKVNILIQTYLSRLHIESFSLISDQLYVIQNATRIARALFELCLRNHWALRAAAFLKICKMLEKQMWGTGVIVFNTPLRQFPELSTDVIFKIEKMGCDIEDLKEMDDNEIAIRTRCHKERGLIRMCLERIPNVLIDTFVQPITDVILKISLDITPDFKWSDKHHGSGSETFWIWLEDPDSDYIYHFEYFILTRKQVIHKEAQKLIFTVPLARDVRPNQYHIRAISDRWLGSDRTFVIYIKDLILPQYRQPHTDLLSLQPLPVKALNNNLYESLYNFEYFNPIQTQIFHTLYHTDHNVLLGAPTGSGKTIAAEIAMFRVFKMYPHTKIVYIAPLKALVRERMEDWLKRFKQQLDKNVVELTGDVTPDAASIASADIIITTPEKWDGVSRSWQTRNYVKAVSLIVIDEIHLLGEDRGPVLEVIVSRTNFISAHVERNLRVIGLSTALANAIDIANWLGIKKVGLYNFRSSVRPVQLEIHVQGFHGKHYCPRMALMNKPTFQAIKSYSPEKPVLIFVSSRRQTRLTALDLIAYLAAENDPRQWVHMPEKDMQDILACIKHPHLKLTLAFGIGLHHAGLHERDRKIVEELFLHQKIQVLIATATLAWGINLPAHLVVIKGTEYFDGKSHRYVDFPITDVMQMAGRAGRPQFDTTGVAVVLVHDIKKSFYKKFLHEPFPVESSLIGVLPEHLNAEIVAGTINSKQECLDYLTWTYFFRRLLQNPIYYGLEKTEPAHVNAFLSGLIDRCLSLLSSAGCLIIDEDERTISPTTLGKIASYYYLNHKTIMVFTDSLNKDLSMEDVLKVLCDTHEYEELPVRHNEDSVNLELSKQCPFPVPSLTYDNPHTKANLLFQAHFSRLHLPCSDYNTDLKSVLDQAIRIIQAMIDVCADRGWLATTLQTMNLLQMILQGRWHDDNVLLTLPHIEKQHLHLFRFNIDRGNQIINSNIQTLPELIDIISNSYELFASQLRDEFNENHIQEIYYDTLMVLPIISVSASIKGWWDDSNSEEKRSLTISQFNGPRPKSHWLKVHADQTYVVTVDLKRISRPRRDTKAIAPKFPKQKEEGWFLVLGDIENQELIAMKRLPYISKRVTHQLMFYTPQKMGQIAYTLYLISDCYLGLDQQYEICLNVIEPSLKAQINTEVVSESDTDTDSESD